MSTASGWLVWALLSAASAALTAIFAKIGLEGVDSHLATLIRPTVILVVLAGFVYATSKWSSPLGLSGRTWAFLVLSGLTTGGLLGVLLPRAQDRRRLQGRPRGQGQPRRLRVPPRAPVAARVDGHLHGGGRRARARRPTVSALSDFSRTPGSARRAGPVVGGRGALLLRQPLA